MSLTFRNLSTAPTDPVAEWPTEAVLAALERGDFADGYPLAEFASRVDTSTSPLSTYE